MSSNVQPPAHPLRIVSLIASATEIVCALGLEEFLIGRSHECDFPSSILDRPTCSRPKIDVHASSGEIDRQVRQTLADALSIYEVFGALLRELKPTHIITQTQCEVCAVSLKDVEQALCQLAGEEIDLISLAPMNLQDVLDDIQRVATRCGVEERGRLLVAELQERLDQVQVEARNRETQPTVLCLEWLDPLMSAGNWVPELVEIAGGVPLLCEAGKHSPYFGWNDLLRADPDVIALMPCGFDIPRTLQEIELLTGHPDWRKLKAVRQKRVFVTDGNPFFNRPGPRLVESAEILAEILNPAWDHWVSRHRETGWVPLSEF